MPPPADVSSVPLAGGRSLVRSMSSLSIAVAATGAMTYTYFALASRMLSSEQYGALTVLWALVFTTVNVLYRPVEQLLSRTIAQRDARSGRRHLLVAAGIELVLTAAFVTLAFALRGEIEDRLLQRSSTLFFVFVGAVGAYAASYFARGVLAGHRRFRLYGGVILLESVTRLVFATAVVAGLADGEVFVALAIAAAPVLSLLVVPLVALRAATPALAEKPGPAVHRELTLRAGTAFTAAVSLIMLSEQTFLNAGPIIVKSTAGPSSAALAGVTFNALLVARAPIQVFQAVQTSILPHLARLHVRHETRRFARAVRGTLAGTAAIGMLLSGASAAVGPTVMSAVFGRNDGYSRFGLALVGAATGVYLASTTLSQAAVAAGRTRRAAVCWAVAASSFAALAAGWRPADRVLGVEIDYAFASVLLCAALAGVYARMRREASSSTSC